jgi:hypothetical protein
LLSGECVEYKKRCVGCQGKKIPEKSPDLVGKFLAQTVTRKLTTKGAFDRLWVLLLGPVNPQYGSGRRGICEGKCGSDIGGRA